MTIAPKIAIDHFNSARFRVTVSHPEFGMFEQWIDKTSDDDMDGGVTAALIEKETAGTAQSPSVGLLEYDRRDADAKRWKEATRRAIPGSGGLRRELLLADERAEKHRRAEVDHSTNARCWMKTSEEWQATAEEWEKRAERAKQERDEARANAYNWEATAEEWEKRALATESRLPTPDAITDEMVERGAVANWRGDVAHPDWTFEDISDEDRGWYRDNARAVLAAALTDPPARPEGAEDVAVRLFQAGAAVGVEMTAEQRDALADHLAAMHVRVVGEDDQ